MKHTSNNSYIDKIANARRSDLRDQSRSEDIDEVVEAIGELADMEEFY